MWLDDGRYVCVREQLNVGHLYAHLRGEVTLSTYLLNQESKARFVVLDNDTENGWSYVLECGAKLSTAGVPAYLEKSRRGGHLWMFFKEPVAGSAARALAQAVAEKYGFEGFEIYPKQDEKAKGLGSLIRLPFGVRRLTGRRYGFFTSYGEPLGRNASLERRMDHAPRPNKARTKPATDELLWILVEHPDGLPTSALVGTERFHGENTLSPRQIARLLRASGLVYERRIQNGMSTQT